ncbi:ribosomal protein L22 [Edhazardia aedis USNM 41457]|uniref:Ribosomal protein L22 n=1 Tax=Edhazardia aedis (strain USNM 41457) TaxID=1003232 RepID=J9D3M0_EDHAE|nr:ribosomal protein L22 [Edhazardia aedis USNM 41457]|eukprot:EJW02134.1 ribosomal protein L22 [Edhazardia aedis USNM 41457]
MTLKCNYSYIPANEHTSVRASAQNAKVSFKNTRETSRVLRGKKIDEAIKYLNNVIQHKQCVPMRRYARGCGRTRQAREFKTQRGRWPEKSCKLFLWLLENIKSNADAKKLSSDDLVITHVQVNKAPKTYGRLHRAHGRITPYNSSPCHVNMVAEKQVKEIKDGEQRMIEAN